MPPELVVRPFVPGDDAACRALASRAAMSSYGERLPDARAALADPATPLEAVALRLVALADDAIVGFVDVEGHHVANLFVDPAVQGRQIGAALLSEAEARIAGDVTLNVFIVNPRARAFYERHGYVCTGTRRTIFFGAEAKMWSMVKRRGGGD
ncbi:GNAT family N-acetyltransferase [Chelatococcus sp. SYSU_G07232]|uniref:GNAT family N-acetyltransferase n=1 Tax=Chelatococcus albus TaxID=3047466 RepID=A0ABT7AFY1_9HYPH|nr:GNAT family N-acetyltransferase [Chelatococcus sp. SYSU_G07232]MDJ1158269.1 GNAT family N-acetyltransferase [Chelatococcus sp. SYSU_G07232]